MQQFREMLGERLKYIRTEGALSSDVVKNWARECFKIPVYDGYGTAEGGGVAVDNKIVGESDVEMDVVPDMGYFLSIQGDKSW